MKCLLKVNLDDEQCRAVDAACVQQTVRTGALVNRSDLVRLWIAAGCPVAPTDPDAEHVRRQSPKPAVAGTSAFAPVAQQVIGAGWRELELGEIIDKDDEYLCSDGQWAKSIHSICVGEKYQPLPIEDGVIHAYHRRKLPAPVPAGLEEGLATVIGGMGRAAAKMKQERLKNAPASNQPAADANAGAAPAPVPINPKGGVL